MPRITDERRARRRGQIVDATIRCIMRHGYQGTTMAHIIEESGLSAGAVYGYFPSKNAILEAVAQLELAGLGAILREAHDGPDPADPVDVLAAFLAHVDREMIHHPAGDLSIVVVQIWGQAALGGEVRDLLAPQIMALVHGMAGVVQRWRDAGHLPQSNDPTMTARALLATLPGFMLQRLIHGELSQADYVQAIRDLTRAAR